MKTALISLALRIGMGIIALGVGIWYLASSIGGKSLTYTSTSQFMTAIGATDGDIANVNGCFLCKYISDIFSMLGTATETFWNVIVNNLWIVMVLGYGIYLFVYSGRYIFNAMKQTGKLDESEKKLDFKTWFDGDGKENKGVWRPAIRVIIAGAIIGAMGMGGDNLLKEIANIIITPVLFIGAELSMVATGVGDAATCGALANVSASGGVLDSVLAPFMCIMGNLNSVMLAGASGGFALMNYAWMGLGGGLFTWIAGLALVIIFLILGFNLLFQVLSVIFKLIFLIIFLPLFIGAYAFESVWKAANGLTAKAVKMLVSSAVQIISISLKTLIVYGMVAIAADEFYPGPVDGYTAILPPLIKPEHASIDTQTQSVFNVFDTCEKVSLSNGVIDASAFKQCFIKEKENVELTHQGAFDFMRDGWNFLLMMLGIYFLYQYAISPKIDAVLAGVSNSEFDFGGWIKNFGKTMWAKPNAWFNKMSGVFKDITGK